MSILVKGMEMPKSCGKCFVGNREICVNGCPLIPIPPHGRLIDADNLLNTAFKLVDEETFRAFRQLVIDATTIIPADGNEQEKEEDNYPWG